MGVSDAPQWLLPAFVRSVRALGATAEASQLQAAGEALLERWSTPDRRFHDLRHVIDMLARVDELAAESHHPDVIRVATWYHGCVFSLSARETYRRNGGEDEVASAELAAQDLTALGVPAATVERVCELIIALKRHNLPQADTDAATLMDADLGTLAVDPQRYKAYRQLVREEYAHVPEADYLAARGTIVRKLLAREALFHSPLGSSWELPARQNLQAELRRIDDVLSQLGPTTSPAGPVSPASPTGLGDLPGAVTAPADGTGTAGAPQARRAHEDEEHGSSLFDAPQEPTRQAPATRATSTDAVPAGPVAGSGQQAGPVQEAPGVPTRTSILHVPAPQASPMTPPGGLAVPPPAPGAPQVSAASPQRAPRRVPVRESAEALEHTTTMESCAADIEDYLAKPPAEPQTRQEMVEHQRELMQAKLRRKAEEAKILRETRTSGMTAVSEPLLEAPAPEDADQA